MIKHGNSGKKAAGNWNFYVSIFEEVHANKLQRQTNYFGESQLSPRAIYQEKVEGVGENRLDSQK